MPDQPFLAPVEDSVPKVDGTLAVGENLEFQRKWWRFEDFIWIVFALIILCDLLGLFGRGWLAKAKRTTADHALTLNYERIERASTPSIMTFHFGPAAIRSGHIQIFVSNSIVKQLGAQRVTPQPIVSAVGNGGITYIFAATQVPADVEITLESSFPGRHTFRVQMPGEAPIDASVFVVP